MWRPLTHTPAAGETFGAAALAALRVTFASVVAQTLFSTVRAESAFWTSLCADGPLQGEK